MKFYKASLSSSFYAVKMVRYFDNKYEDYKPNTEINLKKERVIKHINVYIQNISKKLTPSENNVDGGLYIGVPGIAYMFYRLSKNPFLSENKSLYQKKQIEYLKPALKTSAGDKTSFLLGDAGVKALTAVLCKDIDLALAMDAKTEYQNLYKLYLNPKFLNCGGDELFVGRAGYIAGALWISRELGEQILEREQAYKICDLIVQNGKEFSKKYRSPCPLMYHYYNTQYLGAAHGISYILQILISVPGYLQQNKDVAKDILESIDCIQGLQTPDGNWPCCMEEAKLAQHQLVHWCHGAPGTVYLMAKAYRVFKKQKYLDSCIKAGELVWNKGLLRKGPGICHGVAGNGYVFLLLFRLTGDKKYLHRAQKFAKFLNAEEFIKEARLPDNPHSLYEGTAGTVCFLADLLLPDQAEFPFQDVFTDYPDFKT